DYLQSIALEKTLVAAAEGLKTSPDARGGFDQMAIDCIAQELGEKMKALEEQLLHRAPAERQLEASLLGLQALADVCDQKAQAALAAHQLVEEKMKGFTSSIKALKQQVVKHAKQLESSTERLKAEQVKVSAFQEATAALEHLRAEAEAPATQPAPVPEPLTEPVAMDTASPTAEGEVPPAKRLRMEGAPLPPALVGEVESVFARIGEVQQVRFSSSGAGGATCLVYLGDAALAQMAVQVLQGYSLRRHSLNFMAAAVPQGSGTIFVGNLPSEADELSLHELFSSQAAVADIRLVRHETVCFGFVDFKNHHDAMKALEELQGVKYLGRALRLDEQQVRPNFTPVLSRCPPARERKLFVGGISPEIKEEEVQQSLEALKGATEVSIHQNKNKLGSYAFVWFSTPELAEEAMQKRLVVCAGQKFHLERTMKKKEEPRTDLMVCGLPEDAQPQELQEVFDSVANVVEVEMLPSNGSGAAARVSFLDAKELEKGQGFLQQGASLRGASLRLRSRSPRRRSQLSRPHLIVKNLVSPEEETLRDAFSVMGKLRRVKMIFEKDWGDFKRCAFLEYEDAEVVEDAIQALNNSSLMGECIKVERYRSLTPERTQTRSPSPPAQKRSKRRRRGGKADVAERAPPGEWTPPPAWPVAPYPPAAPYPVAPPGRPTSTWSRLPGAAPGAARPSIKPSCAAHLLEARPSAVEKKRLALSVESSRFQGPAHSSTVQPKSAMVLVEVERITGEQLECQMEEEDDTILRLKQSLELLGGGPPMCQRLLMHNVEGHQAQRLLPVMAQQLQELVDDQIAPGQLQQLSRRANTKQGISGEIRLCLETSAHLLARSPHWTAAGEKAFKMEMAGRPLDTSLPECVKMCSQPQSFIAAMSGFVEDVARGWVLEEEILEAEQCVEVMSGLEEADKDGTRRSLDPVVCRIRDWTIRAIRYYREFRQMQEGAVSLELLDQINLALYAEVAAVGGSSLKISLLTDLEPALQALEKGSGDTSEAIRALGVLGAKSPEKALKLLAALLGEREVLANRVV
ncbi:unnamed protein product, partial [Durusdinium trenchii]